MNKTRMLELADAIEAADRKQFDMRTYVGKFVVDRAGRRREDIEAFIPDERILPELRELSCGTSACIAGWAVHLHPRAGLSAAYNDYGYDVDDHAQAILDLTGEESYRLFHMRMKQNNKQAAALLRRCVELGTVPYA